MHPNPRRLTASRGDVRKAAGRAREWYGANFLGIRGMLGILGNRERQGRTRDLKETG